MKRRSKTVLGILVVSLVILIGSGVGAVYYFERQQALGNALIAAIKADDIAQVKAQLAAGAAADSRDLSGDNRPMWQRLWDRLRGQPYAPLLNGLQSPALIVAIDGDKTTGGAAQPQVIDLLLNAGANIDAQDANGSTALHHAVETDALPIVQTLVVRKARLDVKNSSGKTPLHWAAYDGHEAVAQFLIEHGSDTNAADDGGGTPLFDAILQSHDRIVALLVAKGARVNVKDVNNRTPMAMAQQVSNKQTIAVLQKAGATK